MKIPLAASVSLALLFSSCQNTPEGKKTEVNENTSSLPKEDLGDFTISYEEKEQLPTTEDFKEGLEPSTKVEKTTKPKYSSVSGLLETFKKAPQKFTVNAQQGFAIKGNQGTEISFPANALVLENGGPVNGNIEVVLEEFYTTADIITAQLGTTTKSKLLETGGMVNIAVNSKGKPCKLKEGKQIDIKFATADMKDMQLFDGQRNKTGNMIWTAQPQLATETVDFESVDNRMSKEKLLFLNNFIGKVSQRVYYPKAAVEKNIQGKVYAQFFIDKSGRLRKPQIVRNPNAVLSKAVLYTLQNYPPLKMDDYDYVPVNQTFTLPIVFAVKNGQDMSSLYPDAQTEKAILATELVLADGDGPPSAGYGQIVDQNKINRVQTNNEAASQVMNSANLGWINCDRFLDIKQKSVLAVDCSDPGSCQAVYFLVFKDIRAAMWSNSFDDVISFDNAPVGEKAVLVGLTVEYDLLKVAYKELEIEKSNSIVSDLSFETMSKEELALKLNGIADPLISMR